VYQEPEVALFAVSVPTTVTNTVTAPYQHHRGHGEGEVLRHNASTASQKLPLTSLALAEGNLLSGLCKHSLSNAFSTPLTRITDA